MKLVVFGLAVSSSWGNGHATSWRGLIRALASLGHHVIFFERDQPFYAAHRDLWELPDAELILYPNWQDVRDTARRRLAEADVAMVTSFCPDAIPATEEVLDSAARIRCFYDFDTGTTLEALRVGRPVAYIPERGLGDFDLVLSCTGGAALQQLKTQLGARHVAPLYASVDPEIHHPAQPEARFRSALSFLGSYSAGRQETMDVLFLEPARRRPDWRFVIGGPQYPSDFPRLENIAFIPHVPSAEHPAFYCSAKLTLNATRKAVAELGYCPSARLFEAAACGAPIVSDEWEGLDYFFEPGEEILVARTTGHVMDALEMGGEELARMGRAARERALAAHTARHRAAELENILEAALSLPVEIAGGQQL
ncbi:MAG TPA: glycosyltransferase [Bryobacteraceae bacterium]